MTPPCSHCGAGNVPAPCLDARTPVTATLCACCHVAEALGCTSLCRRCLSAGDMDGRVVIRDGDTIRLGEPGERGSER